MKKSFTVAFAVCLFLLIVGAKWATFDRFGSPMPDWDQWDAEALNLFVPWFENDSFITHLFTPHNEHRVVLTKLQNLGLVLLNGQWDSRLEAVTNALLHAALAVAFWIFGCHWLRTRAGAQTIIPGYEERRLARGGSASAHGDAPTTEGPVVLAFLLFVLAFTLFGLPLAWQNILGGFHSQQYWLLGLSFAAIVTLPFARTWTAPWWMGALAAILALGSMGSGFLAAAVVLALMGWRIVRAETTLRAAWPTLALSSALIAVGLLTRVEVYYHQQLKAKTAHDFIFSILRSLEWPLRDHDWTGIILWLPWLLVAWRGLRPKPGDSLRAVQSIAALGGWVLVQLVATAYARGAGADYPASRYMDTLSFGAMVNAVALAWLLSERSARATARWTCSTVALAWLATLSFGLHDILERNLQHELPDAKKYYLKAEGHMRRYLATNDPKQLANPDIPFPSAEGLIERLAHPCLRVLMPVPIRAPMPMTPAAADSGFVRNDARLADPEHPPRQGLSPVTPPLDWTTTFGSFHSGEAPAARNWKSAPLTSPFPWLKFETAGQPGSEPKGDVSLALTDAKSGALLSEIRPTRRPDDSWRAAYVRVPDKPFVIVAQDNSAEQWLAFSAPVEMGGGSYWAWQAAKNGMLIVSITAAATAFLTVVAWVQSRAQKQNR